MAKRPQPQWELPEHSKRNVLKLYNSLTRKKEEFIPQNGRQVLWYSCGPTVYDASHMGHARSYISFDILRRVLTHYFGYDVMYVMNITDIDDKIIKRARQNYLYEEYIAANHGLKQNLDDAKCVMDLFTETVIKTTDLDKKCMLEKCLVQMTGAIESLAVAIKAKDKNKTLAAQTELLMEARYPLSEWLDSQNGGLVADNSIFSRLPQHWEAEFHRDMDSLNVLRPNVLTRVSEYVPEIVKYIERIISNGLAYESNGSVYFDVSGFDSRPGHHYAKLVPEAYGDAKSLQDGEGELCISEERLSEKRSANDFALWKSSKVGEPWWESPWGKGRPGWHIECSVMASNICGQSIDIHTGGVDLKFPHHDNELAQAEAYYDNDCWVRYFLHSGHLTIAGCKMSKSLKNFVTVREALQLHSARQLRLAFLLHSWSDTLDYSGNTMDMAVQYEKMLNEFFLNVQDLSRTATVDGTQPNSFQKWMQADLDLNTKFQASKEAVDAALCDNVDTRGALYAVRDLVSQCNIYLRDRKEPNKLLLRDVASYITWLLQVFGAIPSASVIGFPVTSSRDHSQSEARIAQFLSILSEFRGSVRAQARQLKATNILQECDRLRDDILPNVGVRLEDREGTSTAVKLMDKETLLKEREAKRRQESDKAAEKECKRAEQVAAQALKDAQRRVKPENMFRAEMDKYSQFDSKGLPTHDAEGNDLSKGLVKKLQKLQLAQEKKFNEYLKSCGEGEA